MAAHWRTDPLIERSSSHRNRHGPQIYVHVEFGVSLGHRETPRHHEVTFRSRTFRERYPSFPRHFPAPNTNFLTYLPAAPAYTTQPQHAQLPQHQQHQQQHHRQQQQQTQAPQQRQYALHGLQEALPPPIGVSAPREAGPVGFVEEETERQSRSDSRSSHGRGRSEPPPLNNNPWDVYDPSAPAKRVSNMSTMTRAQGSTAPAKWKDLPEVPSRYRLGENGLPWSPWSWPMGYDPSAEPQDEKAKSDTPSQSREQQPSPGTGRASDVGSIRTSAASHYSDFSTFPIPFAPSDTDIRSTPPANRRELSALSEAMATVDNGFEDQWWNQGQRLNLPADDVPPAMAATLSANRPPPPRFEPGSLGWAIASGPPRHAPTEPQQERDSLVGRHSLVSPISQETLPSRFRLTRSLSTRSEELWFTDDAQYRHTMPPEHWSEGYYA